MTQTTEHLAADLVSSTANGTLTLETDGSFTYLPDPDWYGTDGFTYASSDGNGGEDTATVAITIDPVNDLPTADAGDDVVVTDVDDDGSESVNLDGSGSSDVEGIASYVWTEEGTTIATGEAPSVVFDVGIHSVTLEVTDGDGAIDTDSAAPASGVDVTFSITTGEQLTCTTGQEGSCAVASDAVPKREGTITFQVVSVTGEADYDAAFNHDPDGDSDGTTIVVSK